MAQIIKLTESQLKKVVSTIVQKNLINESEREMYEAMEIDESKNCPTDPGKWAA